MDYDFKNTILYSYNEIINEKVFFMVNSFNNYNIRIRSIKKLPSNLDYKFVNLDDLRKKHINILYEGDKRLKKTKGDVSWFLPKRKKPIAYSTKAVSEFIEMMAKEYQTIEDIYAEINYDEDAKNILKLYIDSGYGKNIAKDFFVENRKEENDDK